MWRAKNYSSHRRAISRTGAQRHPCDVGNVRKDLKKPYHGCSWDVLYKIVRDGFRKEYAKDRPLFGRKLYFADHSTKSACYARAERDGNNRGIGVFRIIVARVFLGRCEPEMRGNSGSVAPSPGYHSNRAVMRQHGGSVYFPEYMVSDNDAALPVAVIEYEHEAECKCSHCELRESA